ncbi:MAG: DinB family protein [Acidobacteriota bacterium]
MGDVALETLVRQLDTAWKLARYHLDGLGTEECLWRPAARGPHVRRNAAGRWRADWPEHEGYDLGPPSIAWLQWHMGFWWSMTLDHSFGARTLSSEDVHWPGSAEAARGWLAGLHETWRARLAGLASDELRSAALTRWPLRERPFSDVLAWVNVELTKNAAEIGYARFLFASRRRDDAASPRATGSPL